MEVQSTSNITRPYCHSDTKMASTPQCAARHDIVCLISSLPEECKAAIIDFLPANDAANLRLTSKDWDGLCVRALFNAVDWDYNEESLETVRPGVLSIRPRLGDSRSFYDRRHGARFLSSF